MTIKQSIVSDYLKRFPKASSLALGRKIYKENKSVWRTEISCMTAVRRARGNQGKKSRKYTIDKTHYRPNSTNHSPFIKLPDGLREIDDIIGMRINGPCKALVLADLHIPYHDKGAIELAIKEGIKQGIDTILLNGDVFDAHAISSWQTDPRERDFKSEIEIVRTFLEILSGEFPNAKMFYKWGNHEDRYERYLISKAPELLDVDDFQLSHILRCREFEVKTIEKLQVIKLGKLNIIHGHEYRFSISNPVNPARGLFLRSRVNTLVAHFHQSSHHSENSLDSNITSCWSIGCLCGLHPKYRPLNKWVHGFAIVTIEENNSFSVQNLRIIDSKVWS